MSGYGSLPDRFLARIVLRLPPDGIEACCWIWTLAPDTCGYGRVKIGGRQGRSEQAHRAVWELLVGELPPYTPTGLQLDHLCRRRRCVNPAHLELVPQRVNYGRGSGPSAAGVRARTETGLCPLGHDNYSERYSRCLTCERIRIDGRDAVIREARTLLGLTRDEYRERYGQSLVVARELVGQR